MDKFIEHMIKRNKKKGDYFLIGEIILGALIICYFSFSYLRGFGAWIIVGVLYGAYRMITNRNIEYEYELTSGELDIDKIIAKRKRTKVVSISVKDFEYFAKAKDEAHKSVFEGEIEKKYYAYTGKITDETCFAIFYKDNMKSMLIFDPSEEMIEEFKCYAPKSMFFA